MPSILEAVDSETVSGIKVDFDQIPVNLTFNGSSAFFSWNYSTDINYSCTSSSSMGGYVHTSRTYNCRIELSISVNKEISLKRIDQDQFGISFSLTRSDFIFNYRVLKSERKDDASYVFDWVVREIKPKLPEASFDFGALNLFFTANLLFPGKHTFRIAGKKPFGSPSDMMVFESISLPDCK